MFFVYPNQWFHLTRKQVRLKTKGVNQYPLQRGCVRSIVVPSLLKDKTLQLNFSLLLWNIWVCFNSGSWHESIRFHMEMKWWDYESPVWWLHSRISLYLALIENLASVKDKLCWVLNITLWTAESISVFTGKYMTITII